MQGSPETAVYINSGEWNTRQVRDASYELVYYSREVLSIFIHLLKQVDPDMQGLEATRAVYDSFHLNHVPSDKKLRWDRSEKWMLRFFTDLSFRYTPAELDGRIIRARQVVEAYDNVQNVLNYWGVELQHMNQRLLALDEGYTSTLIVADSSYVDSRVLRFAAQGYHLVRPDSFTFLEN
ncbi:MAG: hypothetical protein AAB414_01140 [Patescibacteria group bacterium]